MSIAWNYLDKRSAAMAALKDYCSMKAILATTAEEIANVRQDMVRIGGMRFEESAHGARNPQAGENQILHGIAEIDVLEVGIPGKCSKIKCFWTSQRRQASRGKGSKDVRCSLRIWREFGSLERKLERKEREQRATHTRLVLVKQMR
jgi:hypothetical protein